MMPSISAQPTVGDPIKQLENVLADLLTRTPLTKDIKKAIKSINKAIKDLKKGKAFKPKDLLKAFDKMDCTGGLDDSCRTLVKVLLPTPPKASIGEPIEELEDLIDDLKTLNALPKKGKKAIKKIEDAIENLLEGRRKLIARSQQREPFARNAGIITIIGVRDSPSRKGSKSSSRKGSNNVVKAAKDLLKASKALDCQDIPAANVAFACPVLSAVLEKVLTTP